MERKRVLVIDDEEIVRESVGRVLKDEGLDVDACPGGRQGIELALANDYDLVLTDIRMPDVGGMRTPARRAASSTVLPCAASTRRPSSVSDTVSCVAASIFSSPSIVDCQRTDHDVPSREDAVGVRRERVPVDADPPPVVEPEPQLRARGGALADGGDHLVERLGRVAPLDGDRPPPAARVDLAEPHRAQRELDPPPPAPRRDRRDEEPEADPLGHRFLDLFAARGHLLLGAAVEDGDLPGARPQRGPGRVDGGVAPADHRHLRAESRRLPPLHVPQHADAVEHPRAPLAGDAERLVPVRPDRDEDGVEAAPELLRAAHARAGLDRDAQPPYPRDLPVEDLRGEPVLRDAVAEHAARLLQRLEDGDVVPAELAQVVGGRETGRPRPHDGDLFPRRRGRRLRPVPAPPSVIAARLSARTASGASTSARRHRVSQGWKQTMPQTAASGIRSCTTCRADRKSPCSTSRT